MIHIATDWEPYAEHILAVLEASSSWQNASAEGSYSEKPAFRPETKFERRGHRLGHQSYDLIFIKC